MELPNRKLLTSKEAAAYLGYSLSWFRKLMMRRVIPMYKPGGKLCFFDPKDLDEHLLSSRVSSQAENDEAAAKYLVNKSLNIN